MVVTGTGLPAMSSLDSLEPLDQHGCLALPCGSVGDYARRPWGLPPASVPCAPPPTTLPPDTPAVAPELAVPEDLPEDFMTVLEPEDFLAEPLVLVLLLPLPLPLLLVAVVVVAELEKKASMPSSS